MLTSRTSDCVCVAVVHSWNVIQGIKILFVWCRRLVRLIVSCVIRFLVGLVYRLAKYKNVALAFSWNVSEHVPNVAAIFNLLEQGKYISAMFPK